MKPKNQYSLLIILTISIFTISSQNLNAQGINGWLKKKVDKLNKKMDEVLNGNSSKSSNGNSNPSSDNSKKPSDNSTSTSDNNSGGRPKLSELKDEDFVQNSRIPTKNETDTRYRIAKNLWIDLKGKYPNNYQPKWRFISYNSSLNYTVENWLRPTATLQYDSKPLSIGDYGGKAVVRIPFHFNCECFADLKMKDSISVITDKPQTYELVNFRKILNERSTGEPCVGGLSNETKGGWGGKITLSANGNGDIIMSLMLENYTLTYTRYKVYNSKTKSYGDIVYPSQVNRRFNAKDITVENEMSVEKANEIIAKEKEDKQRQKDYMAKMTKQADSLQKAIAKRYPQSECRSCFYSSKGSYLSSNTVDEYYVQSGNYAGSHTDYDVNTVTVIKNKCKHDITFVGIQQLNDDENGYHLAIVTKKMEAGYNYSSDQGIASSLFTSLIGGGCEFDFSVQDKYSVQYASVGSVQWLKVVNK